MFRVVSSQSIIVRCNHCRNHSKNIWKSNLIRPYSNFEPTTIVKYTAEKRSISSIAEILASKSCRNKSSFCRFDYQDKNNRRRSSSSISIFAIRGGDSSGDGGGGSSNAQLQFPKQKQHPQKRSFISHSSPSIMTTKTKAPCYKVYVAVGSNMGDRFQNIMTALTHLESIGTSDSDSPTSKEELDGIGFVTVVNTSFLHETAPMYVTDQPSFLNGVIEIHTSLSPHALLQQLKEVETRIGRDVIHGPRNGPRLVDLDIIFYLKQNHHENDEDTNENDNDYGHKWTDLGLILDTDDLIVPHLSMHEREFVLLPMYELDKTLTHPLRNKTISDLMKDLIQNQSMIDGAVNGGDGEENTESAVRVLPLPRQRMLRFDEIIVMGILNVTPDSFSDGGKFNNSIEIAKEQALKMVSEGAGIIDIGGESTRPGAKEVLVDEEIRRTIPIIKSIRQVSDIPISIDTRHARVAREAIEAGADIVNDVSGGTFDPEMLSTVAQLRVPIILMHMRGTPETMQSMTHYNDVVSEVSASLLERSTAAHHAGIPRWLQILDPGIGFAKDLNGNLSLMKHMNQLRRLVQHVPILLGPSRKGFIGKITGETNPEERDFGSAAACLTALNENTSSPSSLELDGEEHNIQKSCSIVRVHNVKGIKQAMRIMEAIQKAK